MTTLISQITSIVQKIVIVKPELSLVTTATPVYNPTLTTHFQAVQGNVLGDQPQQSSQYSATG